MAANDPSATYPYKQVHCVIFLWENDDLGVRKGLEALQKVFIENLKFSSARIYTISSRNSYEDVESTLSEMKKAGKHLAAAGVYLLTQDRCVAGSRESMICVILTLLSECLFIVVYGGHGAVDFQSRLVWSGVQ